MDRDNSCMESPHNLYEFVMGHLRAKARPQRSVAQECGVPYSTLAKIAQRRIREPSVHTIQKLADYFATQTGAAQDEQRNRKR